MIAGSNPSVSHLKSKATPPRSNRHFRRRVFYRLRLRTETPTAKTALFNGKGMNKAIGANLTSGFIGLQPEGGAFEVKQAII